jgi:hypothetical protein
MEKDESQTKEHRRIISPKEARDRIKAKDKAKKKSEAERLFSKYCTSWWVWQNDPAFKQAALDMLSTGYFGDNELKGHRGRKETYPISLADIIADLVKRHDDYVHIVFHPTDIIKAFNDSFRIVAAMAALGGVTDIQIQKVKREWRAKISDKVAQDEISPHWRRLLQEKMRPAWTMGPQTEAQAFAVIFLNHVPGAHEYTIATWVNAMLESLGQRRVAHSSLREYVYKYRDQRPHLQEPTKK